MALRLPRLFVPGQVPGEGRRILATWKGTETVLTGADGLVLGMGEDERLQDPALLGCDWLLEKLRKLFFPDLLVVCSDADIGGNA